MDEDARAAEGEGLAAAAVLGADDPVGGRQRVGGGQPGQVVAVDEVAGGEEFGLEGDGEAGVASGEDVLPGEQQAVGGGRGVPEASGRRDDAEGGLQGGEEVEARAVGHPAGAGRALGPTEGERSAAGDVQPPDAVGAEGEGPVGGGEPEGVLGHPVAGPGGVDDGVRRDGGQGGRRIGGDAREREAGPVLAGGQAGAGGGAARGPRREAAGDHARRGRAGRRGIAAGRHLRDAVQGGDHQEGGERRPDGGRKRAEPVAESAEEAAQAGRRPGPGAEAEEQRHAGQQAGAREHPMAYRLQESHGSTSEGSRRRGGTGGDGPEKNGAPPELRPKGNATCIHGGERSTGQRRRQPYSSAIRSKCRVWRGCARVS